MFFIILRLQLYNRTYNLLISVISISMIDLQAIHAASSAPKNCHFMTYVCLEQAETLDYLNFLKISENSGGDSNGVMLSFNSEADENSKTSKKTKNFSFDDMYRRTEKFKHQFGKLIRDVAIDALKGENQTFFIYGTQQASKDKILFGQSQNSGLFLCVLSQIFDICHQKCLENEITLKFSCSLFNKAQFIDVFGGAGINQIQFSKDSIEGGVLHNIPQIIIRNIKTGLKLLNIVLKQINDLREQQLTQNILLTLKLQIDCQKNREETFIYGLSRLNFVKLANPSVNSSLKGVNKNNVWFVNMLNYLQGLSISSHGCSQYSQKSGEKYDDFTEYLKEIVFKNCHKIFGFISITNKMTSNQCLTALLFSNHLKNCNSNYRYFILNLPNLSLERNKFLANLLAVAKQSPLLLQILIQYYDLLNKYMSELNYLQFQYSIVIGQACQRLSKYIFTQQLQDFYYAKRTSIEKSQQLQQTYSNVAKLKNRLKFVQKKIMQRFGQKLDKKSLHKFLDLQFSMVHHFLITNIEQTIKELEDALDQFRSQSENDEVNEREEPVKIKKQEQAGMTKINCKQIMKSMDTNVPNKQNIGRDHCNGKQQKICTDNISRIPNKKEMYRSIDNLQSMFKNKNVGLANKTIK